MPTACPARPRRAAAVALAALVLAASVLAASPAPAAAASTAIRGPQEVGPARLAAWFRSTGRQARIGVSIDELAWLFVSEGAAEGVRGDIAFAQSILETGYFTYPDHGQVRPGDHNYAGIGAVDGGSNPARFPSPRIGVRAQMQHLRAYADPTVTRHNLAHPLVDPRFDLVVPKGRARLWENLGGGNWATDPHYAGKILALWHQITAFPAPAGDTPVRAPTVGGFSDVLAWHPHATAIAWAAERGIVRGDRSGRFHPGRGVSRAQMTTLLRRYHAQNPNPPRLARALFSPTFSDVPASDVHALSVRWAADHRLVNGVSPGRFAPARSLQRDELASLLARYVGAPTNHPSPFTDVPASSAHARAVGWAAHTRVVNGIDAHRFAPGRAVSRAQMAAMLHRLDGLAR